MRFTEKDRSIMIGLLLGDGYMNENGRIKIHHCEAQKEYCVYKAKLLHSVCGGKNIPVHEYCRVHRTKKDGKVIKEFTSVEYSCDKQSKSFLEFRELLYSKGRKTITQAVLELLSPLAIALWWMDDGCLSEKKATNTGGSGYSLRLCTYLTKEENELIQQYFIDNYDMTWNVVKADGAKDDTQWMLRCGVIEGRKFLAIIRDIINKYVPTMSYKVLDI